MPESRSPARFLATVAVTGVIAMSAWGWSLYPGRLPAWVVLSLFLPALWAFVERRQVRGPDPVVGAEIMTLHRYIIAWAGLMLMLRIGTRLSVSAGLADQVWSGIGLRSFGIALGLGLACFGNHLPKLVSPWQLEEEPFDWRRVHRFVGRVCLLGGGAIATAWLALPPGDARIVTRVTLGIVMGTALARKFGSVAVRSRAAA